VTDGGGGGLVHVDSVDVRPLSTDHLRGFGLDWPTAGASSGGHSLPLQGWLLGRTGRAEAVEVLQEGQVVLRMPVANPRKDIAIAFPETDGALASGFSAAVGAARLRPSFELLLRGVLDNGVKIPLGSLRGRRQPIETRSTVGPNPLIVTTLGRTGSTWCVWMLQSHPEIVAHSPFENDARLGSYWTSVLQTLSDPASYMRQLYPGNVSSGDWWVGLEADTPADLRDADLAGWLARDRVQELAATCRDRITSFYEFEARAQGKDPAFFVEKYLPRQASTELLRELYPDAAEVVLVRDLRDMFCSILAFNRKRGYSAFGRETAASDEDYVDTVRRSGEALLADLRSEGRDAHLLRYEDLIREPVAALEPLLAHVGLDPAGAPAMVERASVVAEGMEHHMTAPSATESIGRWRRDLEPELIERCEEVLTPLVAEFGYETSGSDTRGA
jgi:hypothetical protein